MRNPRIPDTALLHQGNHPPPSRSASRGKRALTASRSIPRETLPFQGPAVSVYTNRGEHGPAMIIRLPLAVGFARVSTGLDLRVFVKG